MSVTDYQLQAIIQQAPFRNRVEIQLVLTAENICSEATSTARHADRVRLASQIINSPDGYVTQFGQAIVAQLPQNTTNVITANGVTNGDLDTTDTTIGNTISAIFNDFLPQPS